ncbi:PleD family two-component system response regulator [Marinomonas sp. IMCC 4694]|uniref:response regulator n=1 Tax=Marinomonas sp. IMCC 4694 TaxID=2605432 RepID=UPI0011E7BF1B|nr:response regulator [Marinomonas sp. IMCC 4694]TYL47449.1 response regulator [Marinomonas sp. IMCC 4694]
MSIKMAKILMVDDELTSIEAVRCLLNANVDIKTAGTGKAAIDLLNNENFDLVLLDVDLPDISGFDICNHIKQQEHTKHIPVIFISGYKDLIFEMQAYEAGAADYLSKPVNLIRLLMRINVNLNIKLPIPKIG